MTFYMVDLRLLNNKCGITVHSCTRKKKLNFQARAEGIKTVIPYYTIYDLNVNFVIYL